MAASCSWNDPDDDWYAGVNYNHACANARLIASAPELLAALQDALAWNQSDIDGFEDISPNEEMLAARAELLRAAIAKATGDA